MRTNLLVGKPPCLTIPGNHPVGRQRHDEGTKTPSRFGWIILMVVTLLLLAPASAISAPGNGKGGGGGGGGGGGTDTPPVLVDYGDVFGDLIHILRDPDTGQPIFAQRWVEMPAEVQGWGWGYCAIGVTLNGEEIPFVPWSCDLDPADPEDVVEVDYFGRLNGSRVQERNQRMHFNETITNIKQAVRLRLDPTGRLDLGFIALDDPNPDDPLCTPTSDAEYCDWTTVDSPMENMALYQRMMKYGHIATDPAEPDLWWHGDPKLPIPAHPALLAADFAKFAAAGLDHMLPYNYDSCFDDDDEDYFDIDCADTEELTFEDFNTSAELLGAAGGKHNFFTVHLVQYLNRFLRITQETEFAKATEKTLPAMYRDCYDGTDPWTDGEEAPEDFDPLTTPELLYLSPASCSVGDVVDEDGEWVIPNWDHFSNVQELFMDFGQSAYVRSGDGGIWDARVAPVALEATLGIVVTPLQSTSTPVAQSDPGADSDIWKTTSTNLLAWIVIPNNYTPAAGNVHNFVDAASDALRAIEFFHNYAIPENLYCTYDPDNYPCDDDSVDPNL